MFEYLLFTFLALTSHLQAHPSPTRHERRSEHLPITVAQVAFLGDVRSENTYVVCDLGFAGQIDAYVLLSYGDTLYTDSNYSATPFRGMVSDSIALATHDPLKVLDVNLNDDGYPTQFCPIMTDMGEDPTECALGITNVVETYPGQGIIYYLLNHRPNGTNNLLGAGVATITLDTTVYPPLPNIQRANQSQYLWDGSCEPWFGDVGAIRYNDYIYAYGHAQDIAWVYLARVPWQDATDVTCYEYWNGDGWQSERLNYGVGEKESVFWAVNQGQVVWNDYYGCFLFVYCGNFPPLLFIRILIDCLSSAPITHVQLSLTTNPFSTLFSHTYNASSLSASLHDSPTNIY